ncbi:MAG: hypothetical protein DCC58_19400 [Chloroflexi bacterium]|nr:MAG: hypothetical protein DCC58_19400 [Chloroflexota bacterium]
MAIPIRERLKLLQRVSADWLDLRRALHAIPAQRRATAPPDGWSARDIAIHVANWDEELTRVLLDLSEGLPESWPPLSGPERDAWNAQRLAEFAGLPVDDALDYFEQAHFELMELLEQSPYLSAELLKPATDHYRQHAQSLRRRQPRR